MAYNKKYAELGESVIDYVNNREDAIEASFDDVDTYINGVSQELNDFKAEIADYVVERGQNSNGYFEKWESGKIVQKGWVNLQGYNEGNPLTLTLPHSIINATYINTQLTRTADTIGVSGVSVIVNINATTTTTIRMYHTSTTAIALGAYWELEGRWK